MNGYSRDYGIDNLVALPDFPERLYNSSQLIEIVQWAAHYDNPNPRKQAEQSRKAFLNNQKLAYYLEQIDGRQGWCTFYDESADYSPFICVNIANSPQTSLYVLKAIWDVAPSTDFAIY